MRIVQAAELRDSLATVLSGCAEATAMGTRGREVFERENGATERAIAVLLAVLGAQV
jgi:hypothetical protein